MLAVLSVAALVKVGNGTAPPGYLHISASWFNPFKIVAVARSSAGIILLLFIYWGWDTAVAVNEETKDRNKTPGRAAIISTVILLILYALVITSIAGLRGHRLHGHRPRQHATTGRRAVGAGNAIFGSTGIGPPS